MGAKNVASYDDAMVGREMQESILHPVKLPRDYLVDIHKTAERLSCRYTQII